MQARWLVAKPNQAKMVDFEHQATRSDAILAAWPSGGTDLMDEAQPPRLRGRDNFGQSTLDQGSP